MNAMSQTSSTEAAQKAPSRSLRAWLILVSVVAVLIVGLAVIFGLLVNMDTRIEMNPNGDPLIRRDAIGTRLFAWSGIALFILLQAGAVIGGWEAYRKRRARLSFGLSLLTAAPAFLCALATLVFTLQQP